MQYGFASLQFTLHCQLLFAIQVYLAEQLLLIF